MNKWGVLLAGIFLPLCGNQAWTRTFIISSTADTVAPTSLRGAIIEANRRGGFNVIILTATNYPLTLRGALEDAGRTGDLDVTSGILAIVGSGPNVVINASAFVDYYQGPGDRVFHVSSNAIVYLENVTITGGNGAIYPRTNPYFGSGEEGGGICNAGLLLMKHCVVTGNMSGSGQWGDYANQGSGGAGGGIFNNGYLMMTDCRVDGNSCGLISSHGGGLFNARFAILERCSISRNTAGNGYPLGPIWLEYGFGSYGGSGGGVFNNGTILMKQCTIVENGAGNGDVGGSYYYYYSDGSGGSGGDGGGICNIGKLNLSYSVVSSNRSANGGGGAFNGGSGGAGGRGAGLHNVGVATINSCTISGNSCGHGGTSTVDYYFASASGGPGGFGGGIFNGGSLALNSCTVSWNTAGKGGTGTGGSESYYATPFGTNFHHAIGQSAGGIGGNGGGVFSGNPESPAVLQNTLVALNSPGDGGDGGIAEPLDPIPHPQLQGPAGTDGIGHDLDGIFLSQGFNLIGIVDLSVGLTNGVDANLVGSADAPIDPLLGPLQNNGGFTRTHALLPGSPAIDKGRRFGLATDQRGQHRPHDFASVPNALGGDGTDIGAFELDTPFLSMKKLANRAVLAWDTSCSGYTLEATTDLKLSSGWTPVIGAPCIEGCAYQVTNNLSAPYKFFRLRRN